MWDLHLVSKTFKLRSPDGEERKKIDIGSGAISEKKVRKRVCAEKGGFGVETKGAESEGGYDENASTTTAAADSAYALFACKGPK